MRNPKSVNKEYIVRCAAQKTDFIKANVSEVYDAIFEAMADAIDDDNDVGHDELAAEAEHLADRTEVYGKGRVPLGIIEVQGRKQADIDQRLGGYAPIGEAVERHRHTYQSRHKQADERHDALLANLHVAEQQGSWRNAQTGDEEPQKNVARQRYEARLTVEVGYERGAAEQNEIDGQTEQRARPEHGIVVAMRHLPLSVECRNETTLLQRTGYQRKDGEHAHHAIVLRAEQSRQKDAKDQVEHLLCPIAQAAPEQALGRFFLE